MIKLTDKMRDISLDTIIEYRDKKNAVKTIGEWKAVCREFRDKFGLTDIQAISILRGDSISG